MKTLKISLNAGLSIMLGLFLVLNTGCSYAFDGIKGNGNVVKQDREIGSFNGIDVGGAFRVFLTQGDAEKVTVEADENLLDVIKTEVVGHTLKIGTKEDIRDSEKLNIYITFVKLDELEISGACHLTSENSFKLGDLELDCSGAADVELKFAADEVEMDCSGASKLAMYGSSERVSLDLSGAANLDAIDFEVTNLSIDISGAANGKMMVTGELSADVSGAAQFKYKGDPKITDIDVSGAGSLKKY